MIAHIVAVDSRGGFAKDGKIPWDLPQEKAYYRKHIASQSVLQGAGTYNPERAGQGRYNYVLTHNDKEEILNGEAVASVGEAIAKAGQNDLWVIGGEAVFAPTLPYADALYITRVEGDFGCDRFYPPVPREFTLAWRSKPQHEKGLTYHYERYGRKTV